MPAHPDVIDRAHAPTTDGIPAAAVTLPAVSAAALTGAGLATLLLGVLLPMVDFFIVNVALPSIDRDLHASAPLLELVVSAYACAYALLLVMGGRVLARRYLPDTQADGAAPVDGPGTVLLGVTVLALLIPLTEGRSLHWPAWTIALLAVAPIAAVGLVVAGARRERAGRVPLVPPSLLRHATMRRGLLLALPLFAGFGPFMFCYALLVQQGLRASSSAAGAGLVPMAATFLLASLCTSRLLSRFRPPLLVAAAALQAAGLLILGGTVLTAWPGLSIVALAPGLAVAGAGPGLVMSPLMAVALSDPPPSAARGGGAGLATPPHTPLPLPVAT